MTAITARLKNVRRSGAGFSALCPCHDDKHNSLSIWEMENGFPGVKCHAGCDAYQIREVLGIMTRTQPIPRSNVVATYDYTDENGELLFQTVRFSPKGFRQRRSDGKGGWKWNLNNTRRVLYRLPEIRNADLVYIVEGEKDVETLRSLGATATCSPMGAGKWRREYVEFLCGKIVVILPDHDLAGRSHAIQIAKSLFGIAKEIIIVDLPNLPEKGDVTDFIQQGGTLEGLQQLTANSEEWMPQSENVLSNPPPGFQFTALSELIKEPDETTPFIWEDVLPAGGFSVCSAKPKVGKSTFARNLALAISRGEHFLGRQTFSGSILLLCLEEKRTEIAKHFQRMGADSQNIWVHIGMIPDSSLGELSAAIETYKPSLVIIDPLSRLLRVRDFNDYGLVSRGLEYFIDLARRTNCHIMALHHESKLERNGGDALLGSTAIFGAVDTHIQLKKRDKTRIITSTQRYGRDLSEIVIELDEQTGMLAERGEFQSLIFQEIKQSILSVFEEGKELTELEIKRQVKCSSQGISSRALRDLVEEKQLLRTGNGKKGSPFQYSKT